MRQVQTGRNILKQLSKNTLSCCTCCWNCCCCTHAAATTAAVALSAVEAAAAAAPAAAIEQLQVYFDTTQVPLATAAKLPAVRNGTKRNENETKKKTLKTTPSTRFSINFSEIFRKCLDASERIQMHPSASERVQTGPRRSEQAPKRKKTCKNLRKLVNKLANLAKT